jgi:hypothetical protein
VLEQFFLLNFISARIWMFFGFLETVAGKASAVIDTTVALAGYLFLARTLQKIHALPSAGDLAEYQIGQCCPFGAISPQEVIWKHRFTLREVNVA